LPREGRSKLNNDLKLYPSPGNELATPIIIDLVGVLPTLFSNRCASYCNPTGLTGFQTFQDQLNEYSDYEKENLERAVELYYKITKDFADNIRFRILPPTSPRALWLALRHRRGRGIWLNINGKAVDAFSDYATIQRTIIAELKS